MRGLIRLAWPLTTAAICLSLVALLGAELLTADLLASKRFSASQAQVAASRPSVVDNSEIQLLRTRWFGTPAVYQPAPIANTTILFFDVTGTTQLELINSLDTSNICKRYGHCLVDPAVPNGVAWGLEGVSSASAICYSPRTTSVQFREFIVLPRWSPTAAGEVTIDLVERWNALAQTIYIHEAGHVVIDKQDLAALNRQARSLPTCEAWKVFWDSPHVYDKRDADQNAYHARLRADCRPEIGCVPEYWMGW